MFPALTSLWLNSYFIAGACLWHTPHGNVTGLQEQTPRCFKNLKLKSKYTSENEGPIKTPQENMYIFSSLSLPQKYVATFENHTAF